MRLGLHDLLGPPSLVVHLGAEVVARDAFAAQLDDLVVLHEPADAEVRELVGIRELQPSILVAHHRAEDVADVAALLAREDRPLLTARTQPRQHRRVERAHRALAAADALLRLPAMRRDVRRSRERRDRNPSTPPSRLATWRIVG